MEDQVETGEATEAPKKLKKMPKWHAFATLPGEAVPAVITAATKVILKRELRAVDASVIAIIRGHYKPLQTAVTF